MGIKKVKISELPLSEVLEGLFTIGVDQFNKSVRVSLQFLKTQADASAASTKAADEAAEAAGKAAEHADAKAGLAELQTAKALEATAGAVQATQEATIREQERSGNEAERASAEAARQTAEQSRVRAESARAGAEEQRQTSTEAAIRRADEAAAAAAPVVETLTGADVALDVVGGREYICGTLTSLRLMSVAASPRLSIVRFSSGAAPTEFTFPDSLPITGWTIPQAETTYDLFIWQGAATIVYR